MYRQKRKRVISNMSPKKFEYVSSTPSGTQHLPTMGRYGQIFFLLFSFLLPLYLTVMKHKARTSSKQIEGEE